MEKFLDYHGYEVHLELGSSEFPMNPKHVLVIARHRGNWLLTNHKVRGLEFPGGKAEERETLEQAAERELFEETGAKVSRLTRIGTYMVKQQTPFAKAIFFAEIDFLEEKKDYLETAGPRLWQGDFKAVKEDGRFSFVMKDEVISRTLKFLKAHGYLQN
ncbi:RNA deprotection pyrophosphohydrolase [Bacillus sp. SCS-153A]|uniref:RNA deprotection pyrophosphohydrolase n=1 Tax=Rossellomorea sedimentorum TaxID=3115294 RepID=UPI003906D35E